MAIKQYAFYFDSSRCTGCKACQIACKDKNDLEVGQKFRRVYEIQSGDWVQSGAAWIPNLQTYNLSISCNHCEEPACTSVCPTQAMNKREDGIVSVDQSRCIGCRYCEWACPYGSPQFNDKIGKMGKCDMCKDLLAKGQPPACVAACPERALDFGELAELEAKYGSRAQFSVVAPLPDPSITSPALVLKPHHSAMKANGTSLGVANPEEV